MLEFHANTNKAKIDERVRLPMNSARQHSLSVAGRATRPHAPSMLLLIAKASRFSSPRRERSCAVDDQRLAARALSFS